MDIHYCYIIFYNSFSISFTNAPNDVAPVTYDVRIYNELSTGKWYTNKSADGTKSGVSYMTILEYQDTNFVNNTATYVPPVIKVPFVKASIEYKIPNPTNEYYEYTVPDGVTKISVDIVGAGGGAGGWDGVAAKYGGNGGNGIKMSATITVIPKEVLRIYVGCGGVGGGTTNNDFKTKQKSIFRNPNDSILPIIVDKTSLLASTVFPSAGATNNGWVKFLSNNNVWNSTLGNKIDNVNFSVTFPRTAPYIVSCSIDNYGYIKIDDTLIVDVPGQKNVFSKCTPLLKGMHTITAYGYNTDGPMGFALDIRESSSGFNNGGAGGTSGPSGYSGEGGYGGGSSAIVKADGTVLLVAAGGGGGGGGDKNGIASGLSINGIKTPTTGTITYTDNGDGKTPGTGIDGGGGGGGGGGYSADSKGLGLGGNFGTANASGVGGSEGKSYINTDYATLTYTIYPTAKGTQGYGGITKNSTSYVASTIGINEDGQCGYVKITTVEA